MFHFSLAGFKPWIWRWWRSITTWWNRESALCTARDVRCDVFFHFADPVGGFKSYELLCVCLLSQRGVKIALRLCAVTGWHNARHLLNQSEVITKTRELKLKKPREFLTRLIPRLTHRYFKVSTNLDLKLQSKSYCYTEFQSNYCVAAWILLINTTHVTILQLGLSKWMIRIREVAKFLTEVHWVPYLSDV